MTTQTFADNDLKVEILETPESIEARWTGKCELRNPRPFMIPILLDTMKKGADEKKPVTWNFEDMEYMNSSSVMPVIKALEQARKSNSAIRVVYNKRKKWQDLSFSALRVFETRDGRIQVHGYK